MKGIEVSFDSHDENEKTVAKSKTAQVNEANPPPEVCPSPAGSLPDSLVRVCATPVSLSAPVVDTSLDAHEVNAKSAARLKMVFARTEIFKDSPDCEREAGANPPKLSLERSARFVVK
ncbi:hypothetical protein SLW73_05505 [Glutamicibacter protophormiae]|uniref:hypothetical protein n=1 Tax=Glutamicibacter protophormiae TaxID=37930 RepID=UPI002A838A56|nr:hypothetical protein [Glutamicibacter protophormiae]WPR69278.1 hypothetical protein SLW73_05505 [Glutamicibacter protophormiae]